MILTYENGYSMSQETNLSSSFEPVHGTLNSHSVEKPAVVANAKIAINCNHKYMLVSDIYARIILKNYFLNYIFMRD